MPRIKAYEGNEPYLFISYSHEDSAQVMPIVAQLQERGFRVWYDGGIEGGTEYSQIIAEHLVKSTAIIPFISQHYLASAYCCKEIDFAVKKNVRPMPVYLETVELPLWLDMLLGMVQSVSITPEKAIASFMDEICSTQILQPCCSNPISLDDPASIYLRAEKHFEKKEYIEAARWYRLAAEQGYRAAQFKLGFCYKYGWGVVHDDMEMVKWYRRAAQNNHSEAQCELAYCYAKGYGIAKDAPEAAKWYRRAAEQGHPRAQCNLGVCYRYGSGVPEDHAEGVKWYRMAAEQGYAGAQFNLGCSYDRGQGVPMDKQEAVRWFRKAAEQGLAHAQYNLGICYRDGDGISVDLEEAEKWLCLAAKQGHNMAQDVLRNMNIRW